MTVAFALHVGGLGLEDQQAGAVRELARHLDLVAELEAEIDGDADGDAAGLVLNRKAWSNVPDANTPGGDVTVPLSVTVEPGGRLQAAPMSIVGASQTAGRDGGEQQGEQDEAGQVRETEATCNHETPP
jgi:hypothetical protein